MSDKSERDLIHMVFLGFRRLRSHKLGAAWAEVDPDCNDGDRMKVGDDKVHLFAGKPLIRAAQPGVIITIEATKDRTKVSPATAQVAGHWENEEDVAEWNALHRAVEREDAAKKRAVSALREKLPKERLAPFRRAYHKAANAAQKAQILALVIEEITKFKMDD